MLGTIIPNLATLIVTVRRNMLSSAVTTLMILAIIIAWSARGNMAAWIENNPTAAEQGARLERQYASDGKIEKALTRDLGLIQADRVLIRQFHEDGSVPMTSITHIVTGAGVSQPAAAITTIPASYLKDITQKVWPSGGQPICVRTDVKDITDALYRSLLERSGAQVQYVCPIVDITGAPVGMIMAGYLTTTKTRPSDEEIFTHMSNTAVRVAGYLDEVRSPERESWVHTLLTL